MGDVKMNIGIAVLRAVDGGPTEIALIRHQGSGPHLEQVAPIAPYSHWGIIRAAAVQGQGAFDLACSAAFGAPYSGLSAAEHIAAREAVQAAS